MRNATLPHLLIGVLIAGTAALIAYSWGQSPPDAITAIPTNQMLFMILVFLSFGLFGFLAVISYEMHQSRSMQKQLLTELISLTRRN